MQSLTHNFTSKIKLKPFKDWLKISSLGVLLVLCFGVSAQNLISNSDFEFYTGCLDSNHPNEGIELASPWSSVTNGSVDYYNACSDILSVPWRGHDYQLALSGVGYAALWMYSPHFPNAREYL